MNWLGPTVWALLGVGWLALLAAPLRYRAAWTLARTCAMLLAAITALWWLSHMPLLPVLAGWPRHAGLLTDAPTAEWIVLISLQLASLTLFVGSWMVEDAPLHAIPHRVTAPLLLATALTGPIGWGIYMLVRDWYKWRSATKGDQRLP